MTSGELSAEESPIAIKPIDLALTDYDQAKGECYRVEQHRREMLYDLQESINYLAQEGCRFNIAGVIDHWRIKLSSDEEVIDRPASGSWGSFNDCVVDVICDPEQVHSNLLVRAFVYPEATAILLIDNVRLLAVAGGQSDSE